MARVAARARAAEGAALLDALLRGAATRKRGALAALECAALRALAAAGRFGPAGAPCVGVVDSTGFALTRCSHYYRNRRGARDRPGYGKLTTCIAAASHIVLAALATKGPSYDAPLFAPTVRRALHRAAALGHPVHRVLADGGYDAEAHHTLCQTLGAVAYIAVSTRGGRQVHTPARRRLAARLAAHAPTRRQYRQRWQIESSYSRLKRRLGDALRARREGAQRCELRLRALAHNLLMLAAA